MKRHLIFDCDGVLYDPHETKGPYPECLAVLRALCSDKENTLTLLTAGDRVLQWQKLSECGILNCFQNVFIVEKPENKLGILRLFTRLPHLLLLDLSDHIVIGDHPEHELAYAKQLGYTAIRVKRGKYSEVEIAGQQSVDYTVTTLAQLQPYLMSN